MIKKMMMIQVLKNKFAVLLFFLISIFWTSVVLSSPNIDHEKIRIQALNKITAQTSTITIDIGETVKLGQLYVRPQACRTNPPTEEPEAAGFLQVWTLKETESDSSEEKKEKAAAKSEWVFSGWMFASSPGLSSMDHSVFDLWVLDCGKEDIDLSEMTPVLEDESVSVESNEDIPEQPEDLFIDIEGEEEMPVVKLDGQDISIRDEEVIEPLQTDALIEENISEEETDARFQEYEEESVPTVRLD